MLPVLVLFIYESINPKTWDLCALTTGIVWNVNCNFHLHIYTFQEPFQFRTEKNNPSRQVHLLLENKSQIIRHMLICSLFIFQWKCYPCLFFFFKVLSITLSSTEFCWRWKRKQNVPPYIKLEQIPWDCLQNEEIVCINEYLIVRFYFYSTHASPNALILKFVDYYYYFFYSLQKETLRQMWSERFVWSLPNVLNWTYSICGYKQSAEVRKPVLLD